MRISHFLDPPDSMIRKAHFSHPQALLSCSVPENRSGIRSVNQNNHHMLFLLDSIYLCMPYYTVSQYSICSQFPRFPHWLGCQPNNNNNPIDSYKGAFIFPPVQYDCRYRRKPSEFPLSKVRQISVLNNFRLSFTFTN